MRSRSLDRPGGCDRLVKRIHDGWRSVESIDSIRALSPQERAALEGRIRRLRRISGNSASIGLSEYLELHETTAVASCDGGVTVATEV